jgi:lipopolysaccharide exporter
MPILMPVPETIAGQQAEPIASAQQPGSAHRIGRRVTIAALYMVLTRVILRGIGLISTLILVRVLSPDAFGVVSLASSVYAILDVLTTTGFNLAIIRMSEPQRIHFDTAWTMSLLRGLFIGLCLILTSGLQADFMGDQRIRPLMWVLAATSVLQSLESARMMDLQRELKFDLIMRYSVVSKIITFGISVPMVLILQNYWPLILGPMLGKFIIIPYSYWLAPYRPRFTLGAWGELFHFSKWLVLGNVCFMADGHVMNFIVGRYLGMPAVGLYQVGNQIAGLPISEIAVPIRQPIYSGFSKIYHDVVALRDQFMKGLELQIVVLVPLSMGLAATAPEITAIFLGRQWDTVVPLLPMLAIFGLFEAISYYQYNIFTVLNRQKLFTLTHYATLVIRIPLTIWAARVDGIHGAVAAMLATSMINVMMFSFQTQPLLELTLGRVLATIWRGITAGLLMWGSVVLLTRWLGTELPLGLSALALRLTLQVVVGVVVYVSALLIFWFISGAPPTSAETQILQTARGGIARFKRYLRIRPSTA